MASPPFYKINDDKTLSTKRLSNSPKEMELDWSWVCKPSVLERLTCAVLLTKPLLGWLGVNARGGFLPNPSQELSRAHKGALSLGSFHGY